jgi:hypothetical protein
MKRISSKFTFFLKRLFPLVWFGFLTFFVAVSVISGAIRKNPVFLIGPATMAAFGYFLMRKLVWDLVDEVYDCGDFLLVRNGGGEERIQLSNIINVSASTLVNPPRITLRLANPGKFGYEIAFSPVTNFTLNPFAKSLVAEELIVRVDSARSRRFT